jgi:hypothetical protein
VKKIIKEIVFVGLLTCITVAPGLNAADDRPLVIQDEDMLAASIIAALIGGSIGFFTTARETHYKTMDDEIKEYSRSWRYFKKLIAAGVGAGIFGGAVALGASQFTPKSHEKVGIKLGDVYHNYPSIVKRIGDALEDWGKRLFMGKKRSAWGELKEAAKKDLEDITEQVLS